MTPLAASMISRTATLSAAKLLLDSEAMFMVGRALYFPFKVMPWTQYLASRTHHKKISLQFVRYTREFTISLTIASNASGFYALACLSDTTGFK